MKAVTLHYREAHMYKDVTISPITSIEMNCNDNDYVEVPVIDGIAYAPLVSNNYVKILGAIKETPEELAKNPDVKLVYVEDRKEK